MNLLKALINKQIISTESKVFWSIFIKLRKKKIKRFLNKCQKK